MTIQEKLSVLNMYASEIDGSVALKCLPDTTTLPDLDTYLTTTLDATTSKKNTLQLTTSILHTERIQLQMRLALVQSRRVVINDEKMCCVCYKRIAQAVFVLGLWDGLVAHAYCGRK